MLSAATTTADRQSAATSELTSRLAALERNAGLMEHLMRAAGLMLNTENESPTGSGQGAPWGQGGSASAPPLQSLAGSQMAGSQMAGPSNALSFQQGSRPSLAGFLTPELAQMLSSARATADQQSAATSQLNSRLAALEHNSEWMETVMKAAGSKDAPT